MESSTCPLSLSIKPLGGRDPREWLLKLKGRARNHLSSRPCFHFGSHVGLNGKWQVVLITFLSLPAGSRLPTLPGGWHSVLVRTFCLKRPGSLSVSLKPSWLLFLCGNPRCCSTKLRKPPVNQVISKACQASYCHRGGRTKGKEMEASDGLKLVGKQSYFPIVPNNLCLCPSERTLPVWEPQAALWAFPKGEWMYVLEPRPHVRAVGEQWLDMTAGGHREEGPPFHFYIHFYIQPNVVWAWSAFFPLVTDPRLSCRELPHPESPSTGQVTQSRSMTASYFLGQHDSGLGGWPQADTSQSIPWFRP